MEQLMKANVGRAATCRGPWPRTLCFTAQLVKHLGARSNARAYSDNLETSVSRAGQAQLEQQQLRHSGAVDISFVINYCAECGQRVVLVGSCQELGSWDSAAAVRLTWQQGDNWKATVQLPAPEGGDLEVEYKYAVISENGSVELWQEGPNISLMLSPKSTAKPKPQQLNLKVFDSWLQPQHSKHVLAVHRVQRQAHSAAEQKPVSEVEQQQQQGQQQQVLPAFTASAVSTMPLAKEKQQLPSHKMQHQKNAPQPLQHHHQQVQEEAQTQHPGRQIQAQTQRRQQQLVVLTSSDSSSSSSGSNDIHFSSTISGINSTNGKHNNRNLISSSSMSHTGADGKTAAASWADAAILLAKVTAAASSAAVAAGSSLAAAASEAAATAAISDTAGSKSVGNNTSGVNTTAADTAGAAAAAGNAVAQLLAAVAVGVVTLRDRAANSSQACSSSNQSPGVAAATFNSEAAISQASVAMVKGWRRLLAAAANAQRRAKSAAHNNSDPVNGAASADRTAADGTARAATVAAGDTAASSAPMPAVATEDGVQDTPQGKSAAVADQAGLTADHRQQEQQVVADVLSASAQQQQQHVLATALMTDEQQQQQQQQPLASTSDAGKQRQQQQKPLLAGSAEATAQQLTFVAALTGDEQQVVATVAAEDQQPNLLASAVAADKKQQQQHEVDHSALETSQLLQQQTEQQQADICAGAAGARHRHQQDHRQQQQQLLAGALCSEEHHDQQQVLAQVMNALEHSASLRQESGDPCAPGLLAADRRLAAATDVFRSLTNSPEPGGLQEQQQEVLQEVNV